MSDLDYTTANDGELVEFFEDFFKEIPEEDWTTNVYIDTQGRCCAQGLCLYRDESRVDDEKSESVTALFVRCGMPIVAINDGRCNEYRQDTPKLRILAALSDISNKVNPS